MSTQAKKSIPKNLANVLTAIRLASVVPIIVLFYLPVHNHFLYALILFCMVMLTDAVDGFVARRLNQSSDFGGFLDALSDKIVIYVVIFSFLKLNVYLYYIVFPMFIRDVLVDGLRNYHAKKGRVLSANISGKLKLFLQSVSVIFGFISLHLGHEDNVFYYAMANIALASAFAVSLIGVFILYREATLPLSAEPTFRERS